MSFKFPSRLDLIFLLAIPVWIVSILASIFWISDDGSIDPHLLILPLLTGLGAALIAIGAAIGAGRWHTKAIVALLIIFLIGCLFIFFAGSLLTFQFPRYVNEPYQPDRQYAFGEEIDASFGYRAAISLGLCLLTGLLTVLFMRVGGKAAGYTVTAIETASMKKLSKLKFLRQWNVAHRPQPASPARHENTITNFL